MWYKILKTKKHASRIQVEKSYKKLINNPSIYLDSSKRAEVENAYKEAITHFQQLEPKPKESFLFFKLTIIFSIVAIVATLLFQSDFLQTITEEVTIKECLESTYVDSNNLNYESIKDSLIDNEYLITTYELATNTKQIRASKETPNGTINFFLDSNDKRNFGKCKLLISKESETEYKNTSAKIIQKLVINSEISSETNVSIFVTGGGDIFEPFYIIDQGVKRNDFDRFKIKDKDKYLELESYLDEEFYKESNYILEHEYNSLTK